MRRNGPCAVVCVVLALLVCGVVSQCDSNNETIPEICQQQFKNNVSCTELSGECLNCTWRDDCDECRYGDNVTVTCRSKNDDDDDECQVRCFCRME